MNRLAYFILFFLIAFTVNISAQLFNRAFELKDPSALETGFGGIIAGVDFDADGLPEIYVCNTNSVDRAYELVPRIYKFEYNTATASYDSVWGAVAPVNLLDQQNTWPAFTYGDLDKDGKMEIYWAPVNYFTTIVNPARVLVYEYPGDGSDNMGISDGLGGFTPNAYTTIVTANSFNLRPLRFVIADPDGNGIDNLIFVDRAASDWHLGVLSVDDIPNNGGGLETWTVEFNGLADINLSGTGSKWDLAVANNYIYLFDGNLTDGSKVWSVRYVGGNWETLPGQSGIAGGNSSFKGAEVVDLNNDGTEEILVGEWLNNTIGQGAKVWLLQQDGDTLTSTEIADLESLGAVRLQASSHGDLDADGNLDFVIGNRYDVNNTANVPIFRVEYQGGDITNPANYVSSLLDSGYWNLHGDFETYVGNIDGDPEDEVLYTQGYTRGVSNDDPFPIVVLDNQFTPVSVEKETDVVPNQFFVDQNYPNPFNPSTQIKFGITEAANIDLRIYDALGREVAVLISNEFLGAGSYNVKFDASNLASGTYVYRLTAGANTVSRKMQLLK
jgi:hypothetical protein